MGSLDSAFRDLASSLIGVVSDSYATLTRTTPPGYDAVRGEELSGSAQSYSVKISPPTEYSLREIDGTSIRRGDIKTYVAAKDLPFLPDSVTDSLTISEVVYRIVYVKPISSGDQFALIELQLRK